MTRVRVGQKGMPGPFRRLRRQPLQLVAIGLLGATALAAAGVQSVAAAVLQQTVSENWRGAYDILVTPKDALQPIDGMLPPNTLSSTASGMSLADLARVRAVAGVDVAAPIGEIFVPGLRFGQSRLMIPRDAVPAAKEAPQAYRITATYTTDDGLGERAVSQDRYALVIDQHTPDARTDLASCAQKSHGSIEGSKGSYDIPYSEYPALAKEVCDSQSRSWPYSIYSLPVQSTANWMAGDYDASGVAMDVSIGVTGSAQSATRITLVDPVAERKLLGATGDFLAPLVAAHPSTETNVDSMKAWADAAGGAFAKQFDEQVARMVNGIQPRSPSVLADWRRLFAANGDDYDAYLRSKQRAAHYAPLLIANAPVAKLTLKVDIEGFGAAVAVTQPGVPSRGPVEGPHTFELPAGIGDVNTRGATVGSAVADVSSLLNPFIDVAPALSWPGTTVADSARDSWNLLQVMRAGRPVSTGFGESADGIALTESGYRSPIVASDGSDDPFNFGADPTKVGEEAAYTGIARKTTPQGIGDASAVIGAPVGAFDPTKVANEDAASFVPLGAYGEVGSTVTSGSNAGKTIQPSAMGLGLVSSRTAAIGAIQSAATWGDDRPINAIRVRVAGIDGYSAQSQQKVLRVAQDIQKLGFQVAVVAGSSPAPVTVHVAGYAFGTTDPNGKQTVGPLGTVEQKWSELGAASRVNLSLSSATYAVLGIGLGAAILLLAAAKFAGIPARREQAATMREVGFTRMRVARWYAGEELPGLVVVVAFGTLAVFLSQGSPVTVVAAGAGVAAILIASLVAVVAGAQTRRLRRPRDPRSRRLGARSVRGFGARQTLVHPLSTVMHVAAILVVGLAAAGLAAAIQSSIADAGRSSLAALTVGRMLLPEVVLGAVGIAGGLLLALLVRRIDLARRAEQWATLRACGWTAPQLGRAQRAEGLAILIPSLILTGTAAWFAASLIGATPWVFASIALAAGLLTALVAFSARRKGAIA